MPERPDRRAFLKWSAAAATAVGAGCRRGDGSDAEGGSPGSSGAADDPPAPLPRDPLRAAAEVALPDELGADGKERVVTAFEAWLDAFAPVTEQVHGYGSQEITFGPPDPRPRWASQLEALDLEAEARHGRPFSDLEANERRALLETALEGERGGIGGRPAALESEHVIAGLLGFFFGSPEALDLAYRRRIGAFACRPLEASGEAPPPIAVGATSGTDRTDAETPVTLSRRSSRPASAPESRIEPGLEPGS